MKNRINLPFFISSFFASHFSILVLICSNAHRSTLTAAQSFSYEGLLNTSLVNCTATLPNSAVAYMTSFAANNPNSTQVVRLF